MVEASTSSFPIVVVVSNDPVESGLVASLARPGGNITGVTYVHDMLAGKSVELLKDTAPWVSRVAILWNPRHVDPEFRETQRASRLLDMQLHSLEVLARVILRPHSKRSTRPGRSPYRYRIAGYVLEPTANRGLCGNTSARFVGVPRWFIAVGPFDLWT